VKLYNDFRTLPNIALSLLPYESKEPVTGSRFLFNSRTWGFLRHASLRLTGPPLTYQVVETTSY
jgi:hypothetical protein